MSPSDPEASSSQPNSELTDSTDRRTRAHDRRADSGAEATTNAKATISQPRKVRASERGERSGRPLPARWQSPQRRSSPTRRGSKRLRYLPVTVDSVAALIGWVVAIAAAPTTYSATAAGLTAVAAAATTLAVYQRSGLYLARVTAARLEELTRVLRGSLLTALIMYLVAPALDVAIAARTAIVAVLISIVVTFVGRSAFRAWLLAQRAAGRFRRPIVVLGANDEAASIVKLLAEHPELGFDVVAVFGNRIEATEHGLADLWAGGISGTNWRRHASRITGAMIATTALDSEQLNTVSRSLLASGLHVHLTSGLIGFASHRLETQSIGYEPFTYLERLRLAPWQSVVKRAVDVLVASLLLIPAAPIMAIFALAVKLEDRGPAIFRQHRVGRDGKDFTVLKLRTMVVDAEARLEALRGESNERSGPLFKLERDPRFTRVGRFMDVASINELPQLWNVLRGDMSIVGPRPSLRSEHELFDDALKARTVVRPGITGLWQIEARDNPSFGAYRRFDLHYVENWSVALDIVILAATAEAVLARLTKMVLRWRKGETSY